MTNLIQTLISGLSLGSIYALIALGYTMVYGIAKMLNFAHGDVIMVGAYSGIVAVAQMGLSPWVTVIVSIVVCAVLGVVIEFCAYKPLRQAPPLSVLITAIGVSYLLQNAALLIFGSQQMAYPTLVKLPGFSVGGVQVDGITVLTLAVTATLMAALTLFIDRTRLGKAMRAVSEDKDAATLMGISVDRTITLTFAIGSALAAFASLFYGMTYVYQAHHRRHARYQGLYGGGVRRHRLHPRGYAGRHTAGPDRADVQNVYLHPVGRCHCVRRAGGGAGGKAHGPAGQAHAGEGVR